MDELRAGDGDTATVARWLLACVELAEILGVTASLRECVRCGQCDMNPAMPAEVGGALPSEEDIYLKALRLEAVRGSIVPARAVGIECPAWDAWLRGDPCDAATRLAVMDLPLKLASAPPATADGRPPVVRAAWWLLGELAAGGPLALSRLDDGSPQRRGELCDLFGMRDGGVGPRVALELAIDRISRAGFVRTQEQAAPLPDGEFDLVIDLTDDGRSFLSQAGGGEAGASGGIP